MDILQGTLDLLILRALELAPMHGIGIAARIEQVTHGAFAVKPGSLFPALRRLEQQGYGRMGRLGKKPPRPLLSAHPRRPRPACQGKAQLAPHDFGYELDSGIRNLGAAYVPTS